ncbi:hypothetical protein [Pseudomonas sp. GM55]|uniref:hypothetical protein n=1 Tax=Pseudomonas sp. GM55 TaxID=1144333 RepID=UPI000270877F|nr:hypothetical protein [Pseudomonas sp. GM55]EJM73817.1 hypothetical protein PMI31_02992 [Pseudomonas sp. GM55]
MSSGESVLVIIQVHFHGNSGDPRFGGALQWVVAKGEEKQQATQCKQQWDRARHDFWLPEKEGRKKGWKKVYGTLS